MILHKLSIGLFAMMFLLLQAGVVSAAPAHTGGVGPGTNSSNPWDINSFGINESINSSNVNGPYFLWQQNPVGQYFNQYFHLNWDQHNIFNYAGLQTLPTWWESPAHLIFEQVSALTNNRPLHPSVPAQRVVLNVHNGSSPCRFLLAVCNTMYPGGYPAYVGHLPVSEGPTLNKDFLYYENGAVQTLSAPREAVDPCKASVNVLFAQNLDPYPETYIPDFTTTLCDVILQGNSIISGNIICKSNAVNTAAVYIHIWDGGGSITNCSFQVDNISSGSSSIEIYIEGGRTIGQAFPADNTLGGWTRLKDYYNNANAHLIHQSTASNPLYAIFDACNFEYNNVTIKDIAGNSTVSFQNNTQYDHDISVYPNSAFYFGAPVSSARLPLKNNTYGGLGVGSSLITLPGIPGSSLTVRMSDVLTNCVGFIYGSINVLNLNYLDLIMYGQAGRSSRVDGHVQSDPAINNASIVMPSSGSNESRISGYVTLGPSSTITLNDACYIGGLVTVGASSSVNMQNSSHFNSGLTSGNNLTLNMSSSSYIVGPVSTGTNLVLSMSGSSNLQSTLTAGDSAGTIGTPLSMINSAQINGVVSLGNASYLTMSNNARLQNTLITSGNGNLTLVMNNNATINGAGAIGVNTGTGILNLTMNVNDVGYNSGIRNTVTAGNNSIISIPSLGGTNYSTITGAVNLGASSSVTMYDYARFDSSLTAGNSSTLLMPTNGAPANNASIQGIVTLGNAATVTMSDNTLINNNVFAGGVLGVGPYTYTNINMSGSSQVNGNVTIAAENSANITPNLTMLSGSVVTGNVIADSYNILSLNNNAVIGVDVTSSGVGPNGNLTVNMNNNALVTRDVITGNVANVAMTGSSVIGRNLFTGGADVTPVAYSYTNITMANNSQINGDVHINIEKVGAIVASENHSFTNFQMTDNTVVVGNISVDSYNILSLNGNAQVNGNIDGDLGGNQGLDVITKFGDVQAINYISQGQINYIQQLIIYNGSSLTLNYAVTGTKGVTMYENSTLNINVNMIAGVNGIGVGNNRVVNIGPGAPTVLNTAAAISGVDSIYVESGSTFDAINSVGVSTLFKVNNDATANISNGIYGTADILNNGHLTLSSNAYISGKIISQPSAPGNHSSLTISGTVVTDATELTVADVFAFSITSLTQYDSIIVQGPIDMSNVVFDGNIIYAPIEPINKQFIIAKGRPNTLAKAPTVDFFPELNTFFKKYSLRAIGPDIVFSLQRFGYGQIASYPYQKTVGYALDAIASNAEEAQTELDLLEQVGLSTTVEEHDQVMNNLLPIITVAVPRVSFTEKSFEQVSWRMSQTSQPKTHYVAGILGADYSLWLKPFYSTSRQEANPDMVSFKTRSQGLVIGLDNNADTRDTIGVAAAMVTDQLFGYAGYNAYAKTSSYELITYGQYTANKDYYWEWIGMFSINVTDQMRNIAFQSFTGNAKSNYSWLHSAGKLGFGHDFIFNDYTIWNNVLHCKTDFMHAFGYSESGASFANLQVKPKNVLSLETGLTSKFLYSLEIYDVKFINSVEAGVTYKVINPNFSTACQFVMANGWFTVNMRQPRTATHFTGQLDIKLTDSCAIGVNYRYEINSSYRNHLLDFSLRYDF